jgi:hypothetical protein
MNVNFILNLSFLDLSVMLLTLLILIDAAVLFWVALFRLEQIEHALGRSKLNIDAKRFGTNTGLLGRQYRLSVAITALLFSKMCVRKGVVDADDVKNMPTSLKYWVLIPIVAGTLGMLALFVLMLLTGRL